MDRSVAANRQLIRDMGSAISFNGTSSIVVRTNQTAYNLSAFTIAFWMKLGPQSAYNFLFAEGNSVSTTQIFGVRTGVAGGGQPRRLSYYVRDDSNNVRAEGISAKSILDGEPHFVEYKDNNGSVTLKIDGVQDSTFSYTRGTLTLDRTAIGGLQRNTPALWAKGIIDNVRVWNRILTDTEDADLYYRGIVPSSGLVSNVQMNEGSGTSLADPASGATWTATAPTWVTDQFLKARSAATGRLEG
jgi:hypothetical protein